MKLQDRLQLLWQNVRTSRTAAQPISDEITQTPYYREMSIRYASAQFVVYIMLGVFLAVSLLSGTDRLSLENVTYFIKDLNTSVFVAQTGMTESLTYVSDEDNDYTLYRGGLAVLGRENLTVFTATGRQSYTDSVTYNTPRLLSSGRYLLTYDLGGDEYALYNSFSSIQKGSTKAPIRGAAISDAGYYCIISDGTTYASEVVLYDDMFRPINTLYLKEYAVCAAVRADGRQMSVASVRSGNGQLITELSICASGAQQYDTLTLENCYPISMAYTEERVLMLYTTVGLYCFDADGNRIAFQAIDADEVQSVSLGTDGCIVISRANNYNASTRVRVFDKTGNLSYTMKTEQQVLSACLLQSGRLCLRFQNAVSVYEPDAMLPLSTLPVQGSYETMLPYAEDEILLCGRARALCVRIDLP